MSETRHSNAATRLLLLLVLAALSVLGVPRAHADKAVLKDIEKLSRKAMESFDLLDYEEAKKLLNAAVAKAKTSNLETDPQVARVYLNLGIVYFSGDGDAESAKVAFIDAIKIDPAIEIDPGYATPAMKELLGQVKKQYGEEPRGGGNDAAVDCSRIAGILHNLVDTAPPGKSVVLEAHIGEDVGAARVMLHYRLHGVEGAATEYTDVKMSSEGCTFRGTIPGGKLAGGVVHYYIAAYNKSGRVVASKGSSGSPNIIEITGPAGGELEDENPLAGGKKRSGSGGGGGAREPKVFLSVAAGTGGAYVTGVTEQLGSDVNCCFAPALLHVMPELGYFISPRTSLSFAFRLGFPIGANIMAHATAAPGGVIRLRRSLSDDGEGVQLSAALGGGVIRQTVQLRNPVDPAMDTDTTAIGPILVGGGVGYTRVMGGPVRFVAELNALVGIPAVDKLGTAILNFGVQLDVNLGLMLAF